MHTLTKFVGLLLQPFVESLSKCPKHGLHNPFKAPERFVFIVFCCFALIQFFRHYLLAKITHIISYHGRGLQYFHQLFPFEELDGDIL